MIGCTGTCDLVSAVLRHALGLAYFPYPTYCVLTCDLVSTVLRHALGLAYFPYYTYCVLTCDLVSTVLRHAPLLEFQKRIVPGWGEGQGQG